MDRYFSHWPTFTSCNLLVRNNDTGKINFNRDQLILLHPCTSTTSYMFISLRACRQTRSISQSIDLPMDHPPAPFITSLSLSLVTRARKISCSGLIYAHGHPSPKISFRFIIFEQCGHGKRSVINYDTWTMRKMAEVLWRIISIPPWDE